MQIFSFSSSLRKFSNRFQVSSRFPNKRTLSFSLSDSSRSIMPLEVSAEIPSESYLPVLFLRDLSEQISFQEMLSKVRGKIIPEKVLQIEKRSYVQENLSQNSLVGRSSESSLLDGSVLCLERKNFFRLFFFFVLRRLNGSEKNFTYSSALSTKRMWTPRSAVLGQSDKRFLINQSNWDKRRQKMNSQLKVFRENFSPSQLKPKIFFQILFIPYLLCVGIFATLTTTTPDNQGNKKISFFSEIQLSPQVFALENLKKNDLEDWNLDFFFQENSSTVEKTLQHDFHQDSVHAEKYKKENFSNLKEIKLFCVEVLRGANYSSKLFLLWGFLQVWKGIRPGQSATGDTKIQVRFVTRKTNKKRLGDVQGVEKFSSILNLALQSLESNKTFYLRSFAFKNWDSFKMGLRTLLRPQVRSSNRSSNRSIFYPKGYLFVGPPGSGKTLLAQAIAGEANVTLLSLSASEIQKQVETGTRIGAIRCRNLFQQARQTQPCILFLDEIDSLGRTMTSQSSTNQDSMQRFDDVLEKNFSKLSKTQTDVNQKPDQVHDSSIDRTLMTEFLIQMDSFSTADGFFVIGTTNFLDQLESAFIRSGRFDRILGLVHPGKQTRKLLLKNYAQKQKFLHQFTDSSDWEFFARKTEGKSAADLSKIINESALYVISQSFESGVWNSSRKLSHTNESILRGIEKISSRGNFN